MSQIKMQVWYDDDEVQTEDVVDALALRGVTSVRWGYTEAEHDDTITVHDLFIAFWDEWMSDRTRDLADHHRVQVWSQRRSAGQGTSNVTGLFGNVLDFLRDAYDDEFEFGPGER